MYKIKDVVYIYIFTTPNHPFWLSDNSSLFISCFRFIHVHTIPIASMYIVYLPTFSYVFFYDTCYVNIPVRMLSYGIFNWMITCLPGVGRNASFWLHTSGEFTELMTPEFSGWLPTKGWWKKRHQPLKGKLATCPKDLQREFGFW